MRCVDDNTVGHAHIVEVRALLHTLIFNCMKKYNVIVCDPPWAYNNKNTGGSMKSGASAKYPTLTVDEICKLKIPHDKDCILFLWVTVPLLDEGFKVLSAWGFKYKTMITWHKIMSLGLGYWFRGQTEHALVAVRGKVKALRHQKGNIIQAKARKHSQKPDEFWELIEPALEGKGLDQRLEMFARQDRDGWDVMGNEIDGVDIREILK